MYDVIIIGGGISGCSLLYQLSKLQGKFLLLEKENDLSLGSTKANSGIVHAGYDPLPGTKMAKHNVKGNAMIRDCVKNLSVPFVQTGSLVVAFNEQEKHTLHELLKRGGQNGVNELSIIQGDALFALEPNLSSNAVAALYAKTTGVIDPWALTYAQAECAILAGAEIELETEVLSIKKFHSDFIISTNKNEYKAKFVVNAAGVYSDIISQMIENTHFVIKPKNGEYYLLDTTERGIVNTVVFPCPTHLGKGVLVAPTAHGNIIVGPDAKDCARDDTSVTTHGLEYVRVRATKCIPDINLRESIRNFTGVRAISDKDDFIIGESEQVKGFFNIAGIKSPGLTSAMSFAVEVVDMLVQAGLSKIYNPNFVDKRKVNRINELQCEEKKDAILQNSLYGNILCRCRKISEGEVYDALNRPLPPRSVDAVKRRCTTGMGRCQGAFCVPKIVAMLADYWDIDMKDVPQDKVGTYILKKDYRDLYSNKIKPKQQD